MHPTTYIQAGRGRSRDAQNSPPALMITAHSLTRPEPARPLDQPQPLPGSLRRPGPNPKGIRDPARFAARAARRKEQPPCHARPH